MQETNSTFKYDSQRADTQKTLRSVMELLLFTRQLQVATPQSEKQQGFIIFTMVNHSPEGKPASFQVTPIKFVN